MTANFLFFIVLALVAIVSALAMIMTRNAVYSALYLILNFATIALFYLGLDAPFIAVVQVAVYAGAIMVLFLFVIMLLGAEQLGHTKAIPWQRPLAIVLGVILLIEAGYYLIQETSLSAAIAPASLSVDFGSPVNIGLTLYSRYLLPFEITSILLLVAIVGAIVLTRDDKHPKAE
jgi:NADH-quinone oxidoreductase subunit J